MKCAAVAAWSAFLFVGVATAAYSAAQDASPPKGDQGQTAVSLEALFGKTLISIDGSTIEIIASEGRFSREIVSASGAVQRSNFVFINQRLGTVSDARDAQRVIGVFRASSEEILIQYGDGSTETVRVNSESGLTIETNAPKNPAYCTSWYPEGHVFSLDDRKTALLQYANRLGLGVSNEKAAGTPARSGCENAAPSATAASSTTSAPAASPVPAVAPAPAAIAPPAAAPAMTMPDAGEKQASVAKADTAEKLASVAKTDAGEKLASVAKADAGEKQASAAKTDAGEKLASVVKADPGTSAPAAALPSIAAASAAAAAKAVELPAEPVVAEVPVTAKVAESVAAKAAEVATTAKPVEKVADAKAAKPAETKVASLPDTKAVEVRNSDIHLVDPVVTEPTPVVATTDVPKTGEGASSCLSVESDGAHWGFKNKCGYSVQYAYCTMDGRNQLTACKDGFVGGSVAANGFGILVADQNLRSLNENHDFRWVACQGGAGEVIARLDKSDPPVGRCVR